MSSYALTATRDMRSAHAKCGRHMRNAVGTCKMRSATAHVRVWLMFRRGSQWRGSRLGTAHGRAGPTIYGPRLFNGPRLSIGPDLAIACVSLCRLRLAVAAAHVWRVHMTLA